MSQPTPSLTLFGRPTHACPNLVLTHHAGARTVEPCASPSSLRRRPASPGDEPARRPRVGAGTSVGHNANWRSVGVRERNVSSLCEIARRCALPQGVPAPSPADLDPISNFGACPTLRKKRWAAPSHGNFIRLRQLPRTASQWLPSRHDYHQQRR